MQASESKSSQFWVKRPVLLRILSLDWDYFRDFRESLKKCKNKSFQFILQIMFSSIFNTYHGAPILCCTTTDLYIFYVK